ncbi:MAG TPA: nucleotide pyrophosphatase/phosphodiesterase family protein [Tepidisphaeraceae bacterium]|jgi:predicted AlkP superfamily pyrophosphatase or phosphodiesterase|nr:nucleotide pyrophosphatase/phosphodiesterase family protein [Tepidisphaeraceae bacterium]
MQKTVVINIVGLTPALIGEFTPRLSTFIKKRKIASITPSLPAVTCTVQSTYLTGAQPSEHGIVGNGWYFRDEGEVKFWRQSNKLVERPKIWEAAKQIDPSFTCANVCWWYNMDSSADFSVTPRPMYPADGRKIPDCYTNPPELRDMLQKMMGQFPLFKFWGPATTIDSSRWIAEAAIQIDRKFNPTLTLVYVPHLDYCLQRLGPGDPAKFSRDLRDADGVFGQLWDYFSRGDAKIIVVSEYGITPVSKPVHLNRVLREAGLLKVRQELGRELLDPAASAAFAVADHQIAHIYVNNPAKLNEARSEIERLPGVAKVYDATSKAEIHLDHPRSGELIVLAEPDSWFTYYYWNDDSRAPDFARTVDIHRKPGYDPVELFIDPKIRFPKLKIGWTLLKRKMGMRSLMDVIGLDASRVKGSHGLPPVSREQGPVIIGEKDLLDKDSFDATEVFGLLMRSLQNKAATGESSTHTVAAS